MIVQPTRERTRRILRRTYSGPGFGPRSFAGIGVIGLGIGSLAAPAGLWDGNVASLFPSTLWAFQTDFLNLGTPLAAGTTPPAVTVTDSRAAGVLAKAAVITMGAGTLGVATYSCVYLDGTATQSGTTAATVALTAVPGVTLNFPAGTYSATNTYTLTASQLTDQSGNAVHATATGTALVPLGLGLNGYPSAKMTFGTAQCFTFTQDRPAPGTTPTFEWAVFRIHAAPASAATIFSDAAGSGMITYNPTGGSASLRTGNGATNQDNAGSTVGAWGRFECYFSNSASDYTKFAATTSGPGPSIGNNDPGATRYIGYPSNCTNLELLAYVGCSALPSQAQRDFASSVITTKWSSAVGV